MNKTAKLLEKLGAFLSASDSISKQELKKNKIRLAKLKARCKKLEQQLAETTDQSLRVEIERQLMLATEIRKKALSHYKRLKNEQS